VPKCISPRLSSLSLSAHALRQVHVARLQTAVPCELDILRSSAGADVRHRVEVLEVRSTAQGVEVVTGDGGVVRACF